MPFSALLIRSVYINLNANAASTSSTSARITFVFPDHCFFSSSIFLSGNTYQRDWLAVRISFRVVEQFADLFHGLIAERVLELVGLLVDVLRAHPEDVRQEPLDQPMLGRQLLGQSAPFRGELGF